MILTYQGNSVDIGRAQYPAATSTELVQASDRSGTGIVYTEDFSVEIGSTAYTFEDMGQTEYVNLMEFFINVVKGRLYPFTLTDDRGNDSIVRFTESRLKFTETYLYLWSGSFSVEVSG